MSAKNVDKHNRLRSITVGFRVSPQENDELKRAVALSGLQKQDFCLSRCMQREIVVQGNPKVYKALKNQMENIYKELKRISVGESVPEEILSTINLIAVTLEGMKGENDNGG